MEFSSYIQDKEKELAKGQIERIFEDEKYVNDHKIVQIMNVREFCARSDQLIVQILLLQDILARIVLERPEDVRKFAADELKKLKGTGGTLEPFFTTKDFEVLFDNYNILQKGTVPYPHLLQAMSLVGIKEPEDKLKKNYKDINESSEVSKQKFLDILSKEYKNEYQSIMTEIFFVLT